MMSYFSVKISAGHNFGGTHGYISRHPGFSKISVCNDNDISLFFRTNVNWFGCCGIGYGNIVCHQKG